MPPCLKSSLDTDLTASPFSSPGTHLNHKPQIYMKFLGQPLLPCSLWLSDSTSSQGHNYFYVWHPNIIALFPFAPLFSWLRVYRFIQLLRCFGGAKYPHCKQTLYHLSHQGSPLKRQTDIKREAGVGQTKRQRKTTRNEKRKSQGGKFFFFPVL